MEIGTSSPDKPLSDTEQTHEMLQEYARRIWYLLILFRTLKLKGKALNVREKDLTQQAGSLSSLHNL